MTPARAHRRAGLLLFAALQFVVLTALATVVYAGGNLGDPAAPGYAWIDNFLSDLGATRTWWNRPNHASAALFGIALASVGAALVAFAGTWRAFAFTRGRARGVGIAAQILATASGAAFIGVATCPVNLVLDAHNACVVAAFGLLPLAIACIAIVWWRNGATRAQLATTVTYLVFVVAYLVVSVMAIRIGFATERGRRILVVSQKLVAAASMAYVVYLTLDVRRRLRAAHSPSRRATSSV